MLSQYEAASGKGAGAYGLVGEDGSSSMIDAPMVRASRTSSSRILLERLTSRIGKQLLQAQKVLAQARAAGVLITSA